jgi:LmbE family N-acetylglucosaminyl deacetylase
MGAVEERGIVIGLTFDRPLESILLLGAHPDDIEIGALGLVSRLADRHNDAVFTFVILTGSEDRKDEAEKSMVALLGNRASMVTADFRDGFLPYDDPAGAKQVIRETAESSNHEIVVSPWEGDRHQDHAFVATLARQIFRDHLILEYEIPKYDGDLGRPQLLLPLTSLEAARKVEHLTTHFVSQQEKDWYNPEAFRAIMRLRGIESKAESGFAEAFHVSKMWMS